jgi:hypothetical protein
MLERKKGTRVLIVLEIDQVLRQNYFFYKNKDLSKFTKNHRKIIKIQNQFCQLHKNMTYP